MSENTIIFPANLPEVQFLGKSQQKRDPSQNTNFASGQNRRRRLFGATPVYHEVRWVFTADQSRAFESFFENDLEGGSRKFLMQIDSVNGKDYQLFQFEEVYTGPDKIAGDAYVVSAKLIQFTFDKEYIEVRLPFTEVRSTDHTVSVVRKIGPDGAPDFDLSVGKSGKVLIVDYGITTFSEIDNALNDGKVVLLRIHPLPSTRQYALISSALGGQAFTFSRVTAEKLYTYTCTGLGWSQSSSDLGGGGIATTVSEITENATVTLVAGQNRYLNCTNSPTILVEIADNNVYHLQINGSCTINLTGVSWSGDEITDITTKAEISILNGIAVGVLYD